MIQSDSYGASPILFPDENRFWSTKTLLGATDTKKISFWQAFCQVFFIHIFSFGGRTTREELWKSLVLFTLFCGLCIGTAILWTAILKEQTPPSLYLIPHALFFWFFIAGFSLTCRRLHDLGLSFTWYVVPIAINAAILLAPGRWIDAEFGYAIRVITGVVQAFIGLAIIFSPSRKGINRYQA